MPKRKEPERSREEQERIFKEAAKKSGADVSGKSFASAMKKIAAATSRDHKKPK
ncbi:hypothetical protein [Hyphomicrobium sp.]|uniref:hypothetical protein n=1 Tax=Hyphomicrobium sp. TaxID=82 RepID=UPI001D532EA7|nr:hypothetical protein [Hyphomicrobium sp.]MBY0561564.1 hypothetical protein [Hyphomicrobium sp.]